MNLSSGLSLTVDEVLVAAGRSSNTGSLNLQAAGVQLGARGLIPVDDSFRTNVAHIYAAGDVIGFPALASTSMDQARRAVRHAFGLPNDAARSELLPHGIWTIPEVGMVGETEESLKRKGTPYVAGRASYADNARGRIIGDTTGFLKLIFRQSDLELVGVHIMGELGTDVVHIGMMAMLARAALTCSTSSASISLPWATSTSSRRSTPCATRGGLRRFRRRTSSFKPGRRRGLETTAVNIFGPRYQPTARP